MIIVGGWLKKKYESAKTEFKNELKHRSAVKKAEKESYREAQLREAKNFGKKKAAHEAGMKLKQLKEKPKGFEFGGFAGPTQKQPALNLGVSDYLLGSEKKKKQKPMRLF